MAGTLLLVVLMYMCFIATYVSADYDCRDLALGMQNNVIPDNKITASSGTAGDQARLNYTNGPSWCAMRNDTNPYLQIDLGTPHIICAVSTQGNQRENKWVKTFQLNSSDDAITYNRYSENGETQQIFNGDVNGSGIVKQILYKGIVARYLRILPKMHHRAVCMRAEIYGVPIQSVVPDNSLTSSSIHDNTRSADEARLLGNSSWRPRDNETNPWLQIDLGEIYYVCAVATQGDPNSDERTTKYKIRGSVNNSSWTSIENKTSRNEKIFTGNRDSSSIVKHIFPKPLTAKMIRLYPVEKNIAYSLRVEIYGVTMGTAPTRPRGFQRTINPQHNNDRPTVTFKWEKPAKENGIISSYILSCEYVIANNSKTTSFTIKDVRSMTYTTNVTGGISFKFQLRAKTFIIGDPSEVLTADIPECKPSAAPGNVGANTTEDGNFNVFWEEIPLELSNGEIIAYEVKWSSVNIKKQKRRSPVTSTTSSAANATESPQVLVNLSQHIVYSVIIRGYTQAGPGPFSVPLIINNEAQERLKDVQVPFSLVIVTAVVGPILIIIVILMIIYICWWKRYKGQSKEISLREQLFNGDSNNDATSRENKEEQDMIYMVPVDVDESEDEEEDEYEDEDKDEDEDEDEQHEKHSRQSFEISDVQCDPIYENKSGRMTVNQFSDYVRQASKKKYELLTHEFEQLPSGEQFPCTVAKKLINKVKNRYGNIFPYDNSRIVLEKIEGDEDSDYINASYIRGFDCKQISYVASQGPVSQTIGDFWRMIWQEKTSVIVMLTGLVENLKKKCQKYWPEHAETYLELSVELQNTEVFADYSIRTFLLSRINTTEQRYVFQYHFTAWPDKGVPQYATQLLGFRKRLVSDTAMGSPWLVHCSAGVGRTGTFLAIDAMLRQAREMRTIDIFNYVETMRMNRPNMVQNAEQYLFVHIAILEYLTCGITEVRAQQLREKMNKLAKINKKDDLSGFKKEFKLFSTVCPTVQDDETTAGIRCCNNKKNRFPHIVPLDKARVILQVDVEDEGANYINASYANGYRQKDAYILTQAPLDNTIADFWKMIYDKRLGTIVMLNSLQEGNVSYPKYWPTEGPRQFGNITVETVEEEHESFVASRSFLLTHESDGPNEVYKVRQFQHLDWGDGSVPKSGKSVLDLVERIQQSQQQAGNTSMVVQCSDGVGRSGTLCTILSLLERVKIEQMVDVFQAVKALRISRPGAVETVAQYQFCFQVVMTYLESFSEYSNFNN